VALARAMLASWQAGDRDLWHQRRPDERAAWALQARDIRLRLFRLGFGIIALT
jgi:hypothetical protein